MAVVSKKKSMKQHFQTRSLERVGVLLDEKEIVRKIQTGCLKFLEKQSNRVSLFQYDFNGKSYKVVYDKMRKQIVTVLFIYDTEVE